MRSLASRPSVWIALALVIGAVVVVSLRARGPSVSTSLASRKDLEQHIVASGRVWVTSKVQYSAQLAGRVVSAAVREGQRVKSGTVLVQLDDAEANASVAQAKAAVEQAAGRVEQLRKVGAVVTTESSRQAETNLTRAQTDLSRLERLAASGAVAQTDLDDARRNVDIARAQKSAADAQQSAATPSGADTRIALSALVQSQATLTGAIARLEQTRIVARQDGVILSRSVEPGDVVQPGKALLVMAADGDTLLVIELDERNLAWISLGQRARASADAYPKDIFDADVSYIAPSVDPKRGSVEIRLRAPDAPSQLKPDMTVSVDLTVASKRRALTVPSNAVRDAATPTPWVMVVRAGRLERREVTLGIRGSGETEIAAGLDDDAEVVVSMSQTLTPGQRVRPTRVAP